MGLGGQAGCRVLARKLQKGDFGLAFFFPFYLHRSYGTCLHCLQDANVLASSSSASPSLHPSSSLLFPQPPPSPLPMPLFATPPLLSLCHNSLYQRYFCIYNFLSIYGRARLPQVDGIRASMGTPEGRVPA